MCGIAGAVGSTLADPGITENQLRTLEHRGPDSWGIHKAPGAVCGQTRLSVIDVAGSNPPITDEDGSVGVAFNGEIYNFKALRRSLAESGHHLSTAGDTEVIAHLAETLPPAELAARLDGMFAFAVWDELRQRLVLGRDRLGKKPLYYWAGPAGLVFGSEIKAVLAHPEVPRNLDADALAPYLAFGYVPTPSTFFAGVRSVPPGHVLVYEPPAQPRLERYWALPVPGSAPQPGPGPGPGQVDMAAIARETRAKLAEAVERRLIADVPLGAFLSGGVDSSAVVALMAQASTTPVKTFAIGFEDTSGFDERRFARAVAEHCGSDHVEFVVRPDAVELVEQLVWHYDQPFGDSSAVPTYLLSELTRRHVTVALSGDGGDEVFAGYERFAAALAAAQYRRLPGAARSTAKEVASRLGPDLLAGRSRSVQRFLTGAELAPQHAFRSWVASVPDEWRASMLPGRDSDPLAGYERVWEESGGTAAPLLGRLMHLNMATYLLDDLLPKVDRTSMAHGLEVRSPFLDTELVQFAAGLPPALHLRGFSRKRVLRNAVRDLLPRSILNRRKRGFGVPVDRWFRTDLAGFVQSHLGVPEARVKQHLVPERVDQMLSQHLAGTVAHGHALWALLTLELFLRREQW